MTGSADLVCWECVSDPVLRQWVREHGNAAKCSFCGRRRKSCSLPNIAQKIDGKIREFYRPAPVLAHVVNDSDNLQYWADGDRASDIIQEIGGVEPELADALDAYLAADEYRDVRDGDDDPYYGNTLLEHIGSYSGQFMETWLIFEERLKHRVRYFDEEGKRLLDDLFEDLPHLAGGRAIVTLEPADDFSTLYRARSSAMAGS